jgi:dTDP-4-amino-4,6-dideoxygalactose transaminase
MPLDYLHNGAISMDKIFVTKSFLPPRDEYIAYLDRIWQTSVLTNSGPLHGELEEKLKEYLEAENLLYVANGTLALNLALRALDLGEGGEIITTPFTYVATTSSILWEKYRPVFVDIEPDNFTIDAGKIESAITKDTKAIMAVHVFGYACGVDKIADIASRHNLKVIYDAAHAFGVRYNGRPLTSYGDVSTLSFHATKLFHTVEGGACIVRDKDAAGRLALQKSFGHIKDTHYMLGLNAKNSEFHAAMGLANFPYIGGIITERKKISETYDILLKGKVRRPKTQPELEYNYSYYPVIFKSEDELLRVFAALDAEGIYPRRYFYPSLNKLPYIKNPQSCPISEDISLRIACLPLYVGLAEADIMRIAKIIIDAL